jgi:hypothetical protein
MIILDELAYSENLLKFGSPKPYPVLGDIMILAKYWKYKNLKTHDIRLKLEEYCNKTDKDWNPVLSGWKIAKALNNIKLYRLRETFPVTITKAEVENIKKFNNYSHQKILFVLLFYAKFLKYANTRIAPTRKSRIINQFYVNEPFSNIVKVTGVSLRKDKRNAFLHDAYLKGFVDGTIYNTLLIKYVDEKSEPEIIVEDFENIVLYWQRYAGERIAACSSCGKLFVKRSNRHAMCRKCFVEHRREKKKEYEQKYRKERGQLETL